MINKAALAKIHIAKKELGLDDNTYRAMLSNLTGKRSASELSDKQASIVLSHFKKCGFKVRSKKKDRPMADFAQAKMIRGLWLELANDGVVRDRSERALTAFVKRMLGVDAIQWLTTDQASRIIEHLKLWMKRETRKREAQMEGIQ